MSFRLCTFGFQVTFENGFGVSVAMGPVALCTFPTAGREAWANPFGFTSMDPRVGRSAEVAKGEALETPDAALAILVSSNLTGPLGLHKNGVIPATTHASGDSGGYASPAEVARLMAAVAALPPTATRDEIFAAAEVADSLAPF